MRLHRMALTCTAVLALATGIASADCSEELASLTGGVSKDGTTAPLVGDAAPTPQTGGDGVVAAAPSTDGIAKDGSTTPLATDPGVATSVEDAQAQQQGGATAAEQAMGKPGSEDEGRKAAIAEAHAALAAGDEAGCMAALEKANQM
jgi:hypothetical protein